MGADSKIEWTHATFNPWKGCQKVSAACDHCYAESWAKRTGQSRLWAGERERTTEAYWRGPLKWNRDAEAAGVRRRVFCASLADVFDDAAPEEWREDLWYLIRGTPRLDWLLLTKRPEKIAGMLPFDWGDGWPNVWLGATVENQDEANRRIPALLSVPARVRFLSCEPLLDAVSFRWAKWHPIGRTERTGHLDGIRGLHWVIAGGESGPKARETPAGAFEALRDQCREADVAFFMKQMPRKAPIPPELMIREFPSA